MRTRHCRSLLGLVLAGIGIVVLLAACGPSPPPAEDDSQPTFLPDRTPIILVPGVSREVGHELRGGSLLPLSALALRTDAETLGSLGDPRFPVDGTDPAQVPLRLDQALRGTDVRGLQGLIRRLIQEAGYVRGNPERPRDKDYRENPPEARADRTRIASLYVLYYDWRRDVPESACLLAHRIARIRAATGAARVLLVGHSLGGFVARYYLRYGGRDALRDRDCPLAEGAAAAEVNSPGALFADRLVMLGAPHRGSAQAFRALLQDVSLFGLLGLGLREAVSTMPLAWELLPSPDGEGRVPILVNQRTEERVALYHLRTWLDRGWLVGEPSDGERRRFVETMLARAVALHQRMDGRHPAEESVRRLAVGSECRPTPARAVAVDGKVEFLSRLQTDHPLFDRASQPGDGVITAESSLGLPPSPTLATFSACAGHSTYLDDPETVTRVVRFLLR